MCFMSKKNFGYKCGDNDTSVATFVATLLLTLDTAVLSTKENLNLTKIQPIPIFL